MMPILPPALDDRGFEDLVADLLRRIPAHTPEWTHPQPGDPGRTLIELFAWMGDTILYRANLIPERQRLAFLRLLGVPMRPAQPARGLLGLTIDDEAATSAVQLDRFTRIDKPVPFETLQEVTVLPVTGQCYIKRRLAAAELDQMRSLLPDLKQLYGLDGEPAGYVSTPVFVEGQAEPAGRDIVAESLDQCLWIALLAASAAQRDAVRAELGAGPEGRRRVLSIGLAPALAPPAWYEDVGISSRVPHSWEISTAAADGGFLTLDLLSDGSSGLTRPGVVRLLLPGADDFGAPSNDVLTALHAGVGDRPPRIDDAELAGRLVTWVRLRPEPEERLQSLRLSWAGINAVPIEQRRSLGRSVIGLGSGASDLELSLGADSVEPDSLLIEVEEEEGLRRWRRVADTMLAGRDEPVFSLDAEAGIIRFGDGARGRIPQLGRAIHTVSLRAGGGVAGNLPPGTIQEIAAPAGAPPLKVLQPLPTQGGADAEGLADAEKRIPALLRNHDRAVTAADYREMAARTPGTAIGRVEVLPRFNPHQTRAGQAGVVSVMVLPQRADLDAPAPRPDRPLLESVHAWLDERRPLATELYVIGCDYVPLAVSVAVQFLDTAQRDTVLTEVSRAIKAFLWPLTGGLEGRGWPLGRAVTDREIEVAVARVPGVEAVSPVRIFGRRAGETRWRALPADAQGKAVMPLLPWQLPELLAVVVAEGDTAPARIEPGPAAGNLVAVPVVPERC
ncbi:MAG TPA: putative baseplate assembly protein [Roseomonas sp.]|nr:putative baseplate assembly protein [Roseomonas sp.]